MKNRYFFALVLLCSSLLLNAQETFPQNGVYDQRDGHYAFTNATIYQSYNQKIENATLLIKNGKIEAIGAGIAIPKTAVKIDAKGKHIYPSFIDLYASYGLPEPKAIQKRDDKPQFLSNKEGAYSWNEALRSEFAAQMHFSVNDSEAKKWRAQGFGALLTHQANGISRGSGSLVLTGAGPTHEMILNPKAAHVLSFSKGKSTQDFPNSLMGTIALLRQTYLDGAWYKKQGHKEQVNLSLNAWNDLQELPQIFAVGERQEIFRAAKLGKEFGKKYIIRGTGDEYMRTEEIKATGSSLIVSLKFPKAYELENPFDALQADLADLKHWELAPENPGRLAKAGINFTLSTHGLKNKKDFLTNLRKAIKAGLSEEQALKALTYAPANLLGAYANIGSLEKGKLANFFIASNNLFSEDGKILHHWIKGKANVIEEWSENEIGGIYDLKIGTQKYNLQVREKEGKNKIEIVVNDSTEIKVKHSLKKGLIHFSFTPENSKGKIALAGTAKEGQWSGSGTLADGTWVTWTAKRNDKMLGEREEPEGKEEDKKEEEKSAIKGEVVYPFLPYGWSEKPKAATYLVRNATVWTNEADGILENTDVLFKDGKVVQIGKDLNAANAILIDGTDKHLTCGIIDEHSHIAISRGVNEGTQASSAEVRIGDVINAEDINIYRQLGGGVTTSQLLHGSANPIGGQSAIIKLRWGYTPEEMKFEGADGFIKFALGENVKQSNWGDNQRIRFPQTRMGVEQVFIDHFTRALEYKKQQQSGQSYRRDLELEALLEIIESKRFISCHSYQQGEINMLMKVAEQFGFTVNTFTHILEGYKVADKMKAHGAGGSTFSDWWAYKYEVIDAIPHNGAIMHDQGVVVAYNSDDAEMARRLNQEAAKAVMYSDLSEEEAWKFVTLNPAKLLHIDDRVGSVKAGKDADLVLWSDHPLSVYTKAEMTWVDGIKFFDRAEDKKMRKAIQEERARLIQKMIGDDSPGGKSGPPMKKFKHLYHCDDVHDEMH